MAKKDEHKAKSANGGSNKVQGFVFGINLEGSEDVVMEGIKAFTSALSKTSVVVTTAVARPALSNPKGNGLVLEASEPQEDVLDNDVIENEDNDHEEQTQEASNNATERKRRIPPQPKILHDLDINAGDVPLKTFVEQKNPQKAQDRIVVVAVWLKKYRNLGEVSRDELYNCYQQMGGTSDWKSPNDWDALLRQLGRRKGWFDKGSKEPYFSTTIIASNYVDGLSSTSA